MDQNDSKQSEETLQRYKIATEIVNSALKKVINEQSCDYFISDFGFKIPQAQINEKDPIEYFFKKSLIILNSQDDPYDQMINKSIKIRKIFNKAKKRMNVDKNDSNLNTTKVQIADSFNPKLLQTEDLFKHPSNF